MHVSGGALKLAASEHSPGSPCRALTLRLENCMLAWRNTHLAILHAIERVHELNVAYRICWKAGDGWGIIEEKSEINWESDFYSFLQIFAHSGGVYSSRFVFFVVIFYATVFFYAVQKHNCPWPKNSLSTITAFRIFRGADKDQDLFLFANIFCFQNTQKCRCIFQYSAICLECFCGM